MGLLSSDVNMSKNPRASQRDAKVPFHGVSEQLLYSASQAPWFGLHLDLIIYRKEALGTLE